MPTPSAPRVKAPAETTSVFMRAAAALLVVLAASVTYADVAGFGFLYGDDERHIRDNPFVHGLTVDNLLWMFSSAEIDYWRPLSFLTHAIDYTVWGQYIGGHHLTSVAIHAASALFVMAATSWLWRRLPGSATAPAVHGLAAALLAGLVFAVHPQHVETTAWLAERKGVLSSCFYLAAMYAYLKASNGALRWRVVTLITALLALLSKPLAVSLPLALLMLDVYPLKRLRPDVPLKDWLVVLAEKLPYVLLAVAVSLYTYLAIETGGYLNTTEVIGTVERLINAARSVWLYIGRFLAPVSLVPIYPMVVVDNSPTLANLLAPGALVLVVAVGLWRWWRGQGALIAVVGLHLAMLGPVLGLVHVGAQSSADRYAYLPGAWMSVVLALLVASAVQRLSGHRTARLAVIGAVVIGVAGFALIGRQQVRVWSSDTAMANVVAHHYPEWQPGQDYVRAMEAYKAGDFARAAPLFEIAIRQGHFVARGHMFLAHCLEELGKPKLAQAHMRTALRLKPGSLFLLQTAAQLELRAGRLESAEALLTRLAAAAPGDTEVVRQQALLRVQLGDPQSAYAMLGQLAEQEPRDPRNQVLLGIVAQRLGNVADARAHFVAALEIDPENEDARHNLEQLPPR